jgi:hypothetical protein
MGEHIHMPSTVYLQNVRGLATLQSACYVRDMTRRKPQFRMSVSAYNAALYFLARPKQYPLTDAERANHFDRVLHPAHTNMKRPGAGSSGAVS